MLCGGAITWKGKKQECVAQSTMEDEYIALNAKAKEAIYLKQFSIESAFKDPFPFCVITILPLLSPKIQNATLAQNI